jgi:hypothetical protein
LRGILDPARVQCAVHQNDPNRLSHPTRYPIRSCLVSRCVAKVRSSLAVSHQPVGAPLAGRYRSQPEGAVEGCHSPPPLTNLLPSPTPASRRTEYSANSFQRKLRVLYDYQRPTSNKQQATSSSQKQDNTTSHPELSQSHVKPLRRYPPEGECGVGRRGRRCRLVFWLGRRIVSCGPY